MDFDCLRGLAPADFFHWFGQVLQIPHGSFKEEKLVDYLIAFAQKRNFPWEKDSINNLPTNTEYFNEITFRQILMSIWEV